MYERRDVCECNERGKEASGLFTVQIGFGERPVKSDSFPSAHLMQPMTMLDPQGSKIHEKVV